MSWKEGGRDKERGERDLLDDSVFWLCKWWRREGEREGETWREGERGGREGREEIV